MKKFEVADIVREHVGRDKLSEPMLEWCLGRGLREIEKRDNFYWMEAEKVFDILDGQQEYSFTEDLLINDFKEAELMLVSDRTADDPCWEEISGPEPFHSTKINFTEGSEGKPAFWTLQESVDEPTIVLWPPLPDQDYRAQLIYWRWTSLPESSRSDSHEVLRRWPEALIYLACEQGVMVTTKDPDQAMYWRSLFINIDPKVNTEYKRIKDYQQSRHSRQRFRTSPSNGNTTMTQRLNDRQRMWY